MVQIEIKRMQSITNKQLGEYYAKYLMENDSDRLYQDLAFSIDMIISDNITDFDIVDVVEAVSELSFNDIAEILQTAAQCLKNIGTTYCGCDENKD